MSAIMIDPRRWTTGRHRPSPVLCRLVRAERLVDRTHIQHARRPVDCQRHGLTIGADTVPGGSASPKKRSPACAMVRTAPRRLVTALEALEAFADFADPGTGEVWCNGASFDFPDPGQRLPRRRRKTPWRFWQERDLRTPQGPQPGPAHRAQRHPPQRARRRAPPGTPGAAHPTSRNEAVA